MDILCMFIFLDHALVNARLSSSTDPRSGEVNYADMIRWRKMLTKWGHGEIAQRIKATERAIRIALTEPNPVAVKKKLLKKAPRSVDQQELLVDEGV